MPFPRFLDGNQDIPPHWFITDEDQQASTSGIFEIIKFKDLLFTLEAVQPTWYFIF